MGTGRWATGGRIEGDYGSAVEGMLFPCVIFVFFYFYPLRNDVHLISPSMHKKLQIYPRSISSLVNSTRLPAAFVN